MSIPRLAALTALAAVVLAACTSQSPAASVGGSASAGPSAAPCVVGVSWNNFQQPRWAAHDEPNLKKTVEDGGGSYISADANLSAEQQLTDVDTLISQGANVLVLLA
jgi:D-xylose transport system substrate-binding protein